MGPDPLDVALSLLTAASGEVLPRLSAAVADVLPHRWTAALIAGRIRVAHAGGDGAIEPTAMDLAILAERTSPGIPWYGPATVGGVAHPTLVVVAAEPRPAGHVLVLVDVPKSRRKYDVVQRLWEIAAIRLLQVDQPVLHTAAERFAAGEHAKRLLMAKDTQAATLTAILRALRSRQLDDTTSRQMATAIASTALTSLHAAPVDGEHSVGHAFASLSDQLRPLFRHTDVELQLAAPEHSERLLSLQISEAATTVVRGCVLVMLEHTTPHRIRVEWTVTQGQLKISVRDDGDGALFPQALAEYRLRERLVALGGNFAVDAVPGWGTALTAHFPLAPPPGPDVNAVDVLSPRELEVFAQLARGLSNQRIAEHLHVTEHTVKFHVRHILAKLGVRSRGEAAAMARAARF